MRIRLCKKWIGALVQEVDRSDRSRRGGGYVHGLRAERIDKAVKELKK
jgi:hypothetical protein